jgi:hypothetical protein
MCDDLSRRHLLRGVAAASALGAVGARPARGWALDDPLGDGGFEFEAMGEEPWSLDAAALGAAEFDQPPILYSSTRAIAIAAPPIVSRASWGADESRRTGTRSFAPLRKVVVHHTAGTSNPSDPKSQMRSIYDYQVDDRDWSDIGYHFVIDQHGVIYEGRWARAYAAGETITGEDGRGNLVVGAHAYGINTGSLGVCLMGNFMDVQPTEAALAAATWLIAWKLGPRRIDPFGSDPFVRFDGQTVTLPNIMGHRDAGSTLCPGANLYPVVPALRARVQRRLAGTLIGYRILASDGTISSYGAAADHGDVARAGGRNAVAIASGALADGYYALTDEGRVWPFGSARSLGSLSDRNVRGRATHMASTATGEGYWVLTEDGLVTAFGDAIDAGNLPALGVQRRGIRRIQPTPSGRGYWLLGDDGGVFCFGDAQFLGSLPGINIRTTAVDLQPTPTGRGYWLLGADGGVFCFGDAQFYGSVPGLPIPSWVRPAVAVVASLDGTGYHVLASDGGVFSFGSVPFHGSAAELRKRPLGLAPTYG